MTTPEADSQRSRVSFDTVAADYDRYRRGYPREVLDHIAAAAHIGPGTRVFEIGCGTGQMTRPLLEAGAFVTALELGPELARIARKNLAGFSQVSIQVAAFEDWPLPDNLFDAVLAATSFHWVDPATRADKAAQALRPGGCLIAVYPHHVQGRTTFFKESQPCYLKWALSRDPDWHPPLAHEVPFMYQDIDACSAFESVTRRRIPKTAEFTTAEYLGLLGTDSLVLTLPRSAREGFLEDMGTLIDARYGGRVARDFLYEIVFARKRG